MKNSYESFLGDANFPWYGLHHRKGGDIAFYESIYEQYSTLSFTHQEDRPIAIAGLEKRLITALQQKGGSQHGCFGIFDEYWGRGLLWQRASGAPKMTRIVDKRSGGITAPSWSWMGHTGSISFMKHNPHTVEWLVSEVTLPWENGPRQDTTSYRGDVGLKGLARNFKIPLGMEATYKADIVFEDSCAPSGRKLKCMVVGRIRMEDRTVEQVRNYVLVLTQKDTRGRTNVYERIGAGSLQGSLIDFGSPPLNVVVE
jgi:hypothetical protein